MKKLFFFLLLSAKVIYGQKDTLVSPPHIITEGLDPIPASIAAEVKRYTESRTAVFNDWIPLKKK